MTRNNRMQGRAARWGMAALLVSCVTPAAWSQAEVPQAAADFWSFKPVAAVKPPETHEAGWALNPVDRFVLARLERAGLKPAPAADPRTLIRRVYFDLTGLPPTPG